VDINPDLLKLMKRAGLVSVELAVESGSPRILKAIKKNIKLVQFETFLKEAYRLGIKSYVFCMVSFPDETAEDVEMTISLIKKNIKYIYYAVLQTTRILPDAALTHIAKEKGVIPKDFNWFKPFVETKDSLFKNSNYSTIPLYLERLTEKDIQHAIDEFDDMQKLHLVHKDLIMKLIKINLRIDVLKKLTFQVFIRKLKVLFEMVYVAYRNKSKDITNVNKSP
jgi:radical SAM superfamily enzyme YgiQ (UPF0313 family)